MIIPDSCAFIWDALSHKKLTKNAKRQIIRAEQKQQLMICDITLWEVAMLVSKGRFTIGASASTFCQLAIQARNIEVLPITPDIAECPVSFDHTVNNDPADRLIAATTIIHDAALVTADRNLRESPLLKTIW